MLGYRPKLRAELLDGVRRNPRLVFFGLLLVALLVFGTVMLWLAEVETALEVLGLVAATLIPLSELSIRFVQNFLLRRLPPMQLPRLDFKEKIAPEFPTFVVIPTLLTSPDGVAALCERLEQHYLSNPDPQLYFALLTDFPDAAEEVMPADAELKAQALEAIRQLNHRYAGTGARRFHLLHRKRQWNPAEGAWMAWERKRGKLQEFNKLLRGSTATSYELQSGDLTQLPRIRFVLTLDSDTVLPREAAARLVGTLAHPLNQPALAADGRTVVRGYGLLQPRVNFLPQTHRKSRFARWFAFSAGIDPYSNASSDLYQDLFDSGTFTGKGLYDVDAFEAVTGHAFPPNAVLSHDLIEGNFARCALVTRTSNCSTSSRPATRPTPGASTAGSAATGSCIPWLGRPRPGRPTAAGRAHRRARNPLGTVERWKIFDNLRRSLVAPSLVADAGTRLDRALPGEGWHWSLLALAIGRAADPVPGLRPGEGTSSTARAGWPSPRRGPTCR